MNNVPAVQDIGATAEAFRLGWCERSVFRSDVLERQSLLERMPHPARRTPPDTDR